MTAFMTYKEECESMRQKLAIFESAVEHVTEEGKTKRSFSVSEGWAMVHKDRLIDLECAEEQLAAIQAYSQQLREAVRQNHEWHENYDEYGGYPESELAEVNEQAIALPQDTTSLSSMIAKAGEVMRESVIEQCIAMGVMYRDGAFVEEIRALPGVTLEDLSK